MILRHTYREIAYLLGCYLVVADREINEHEVKVLDRYLAMCVNGQADGTCAAEACGTGIEELCRMRNEIFSDDEGRVGEKDLIVSLKLKNLSGQQKVEVMDFLCGVAFGDEFVSAREMEILNRAAEAMGFNFGDIFNHHDELSKQRIKESRLSPVKRFVGNVENYFFDFFADSGASAAAVVNRKHKIIDMLLGSLGYSASVEKITETATVDLDRVLRIMDLINQRLSYAYVKLSENVARPDSSKEVENVATAVETVRDSFKDMMEVALANNKEVLEKKKRNIRYFTIAFMGRTKAGKSTFHKVVTQQENDDIGVGKLRTTRFNRSWYWDKLRIVDTPGIGAPGGDVDTEIARSIIDEADIICYIVTSDSIQETEFDFFDTIKERNKPLYIILNVKSNLSQAIRLKRFVADPHSWRLADGPQSIAGHIARIHDRLDGKYNMDAVQIIPLHLLAAQMGFSGEYDPQTSQALVEGSNIFEFIRSVKMEVHRTGSLKKSLSVIDGSAYLINSLCRSILSDCKVVDDALSVLVSKRDKFNSFLSRESKLLYKDIDILFDNANRELLNRASSFAADHYDDDQAGVKWQNDEVARSIMNRLNENLNYRVEDFNQLTTAEINEMSSDIKFCLNLSFSTSSLKSCYKKSFKKAVGIGLTIAVGVLSCFNPGALVLFGAGLISTIITSLFDSKETKKKKAIEKLNDQLSISISKTIDDNRNEAKGSVRKSLISIKNFINNILSTYISNTQDTVSFLKEFVQSSKMNENEINSLVGLRILEFVGKNNFTDKELSGSYPVERDWTRQSITYKFNVPLSDQDVRKAELATQMKIFKS